jgi:hypothetical protein
MSLTQLHADMLLKIAPTFCSKPKPSPFSERGFEAAIGASAVKILAVTFHIQCKCGAEWNLKKDCK